MATARPFAYNTGSTISGTTQIGSLAVGTPSSGFTGNPKWWNGPDEDLGYVICRPNTIGNQPNPDNVPAYIRFSRSKLKTDQSFINLVNSVFNQTFTGTTQCSSYLTTNGYWTSWVLPYTDGVYKTTYSGYFADNVSFFATATPASVGGNPATSVQTTSIFEPATDDGSNFSCQWLGYFKPTTTETYTFFTSSDDASYMWIGETAITGFTTLNATVKNGGAHGNQERSGTASLTNGTYYPIRIQFGEQGGGDVMTFNYSTPTISKTTTVTGLVFYNSTTNGF
jgi:hypothetical protein